MGSLLYVDTDHVRFDSDASGEVIAMSIRSNSNRDTGLNAYLDFISDWQITIAEMKAVEMEMSFRDGECGFVFNRKMTFIGS